MSIASDELAGSIKAMRPMPKLLAKNLAEMTLSA
jgi:hypothetical protein